MRHLAILLLAGALVGGCGDRAGDNDPRDGARISAGTDVAAGVARSVSDVDAANAAAAAPLPPPAGG
ncbi:MAG: hypothetical protein WCZ66_04220 [Sphingomonadaceae bacterium]